MDVSQRSKALDMNAAYLGVDPLRLMENAGARIAACCQKYDSVAVFSGLGNNGGDGLVAARHLSGSGKKVTVFTLQGNRSRENQRNFDILQKLDSVEVIYVRDSADVHVFDLSGYDVIVDALLGVGARGEIREPVKSLVDLMNRAGAYKIAADCPTPGFSADLILSFHFKKTEDAQVESIGIPAEAESYCGPGDVYLAVPKRGGSEHKGDFGRVLIVGGSREYSQTPALVGYAALRAGADLATICCPSYAAEKMMCCPDLIIHPLESGSHLSESDVESILSENYDSLVLGNGLGLAEETGHAVKKILKETEKPVVVDADALKLMKMRHIKANHILTPHAKEFELLFGEAPLERVAAVEKQAKDHGCVVLLKGPVDVVSDGKRTKLNRTGNPGMTVGGTGDVLAGIVGALAAKADAFSAACAGAFLSGVAGDIAAEELGCCLTASDCIERIPYAKRFCEAFE
jgi:NAD(P)H-hydrate epimerase